mmetsp:Transcript_40589/g.90222  ORF Transcript_40589/g.90222 Transcript_40589/m.90222 type:complete len:1163 (+) Transcript_40589:155-3643(+)|eukprot:CAMPEP_0202894964 /NCGR_PEP_ID=MMETSP1392-20130828/4252_1 /ASSEMBLY_ACC=CAM_ASM_000868 /TAXON_ID=225041 /ORGANISM="Chlamydomonas chlamydogama, Strain SAG 11-48b" /LENGTH=1162 /DNA_ID=CAMNT_0049579823 /DNA_START=87 /DNA_END=3575 /DNA_ORIENTATION=-
MDSPGVARAPLESGAPSMTGRGYNQHTGEGVFDSGNGKAKPRKPYTLTKQRERWTEEEHAKFVEALRLFGRAWRKIEEYIGTKTAVQIRSHAQKFFSKVERQKETGEGDEAETIDIPPPRPKRKPSRPYPKKENGDHSGAGTGNGDVSENCGPSYTQEGTHSYRSLPIFRLQQPHSTANFPSVSGQTGCEAEVSEATVAAVAAAASAAAAAAAAAVVAAAGQQVQAHLQVNPPRGFPFFGIPPALLAQVSLHSTTLDALVNSTRPPSGLMAHAAQGGKSVAGHMHTHGGHTHGLGATPHNRPFKGMDGSVQLMGTLAEATATTTDNPITGSRQTRGSDGDSACSRETDANKSMLRAEEAEDDLPGEEEDVNEEEEELDLEDEGEEELMDEDEDEGEEVDEEDEEDAEEGRLMKSTRTSGANHGLEDEADETTEGMVAALQMLRSRVVSKQQVQPLPAAASAPARGSLYAPSSGPRSHTRQNASHTATHDNHAGSNSQFWQLLGRMDSSKSGLAPNSLAQGRTATSDGSGSSGRGLKRPLHVTRESGFRERERSDRQKAERDQSPGYSDNHMREPHSPSLKEPTAKMNPSATRGSASASEEDTNGTNHRRVYTKTASQRGPKPLREAQASNPTHYGSGNGNGHGSNSNGNRSSGNGNGSSGNEETEEGHMPGTAGKGHPAGNNLSGNNGNGSSGNGNGSSGNGNGSSGNGNGSSGNRNGSSGNGNGSSGNGNGHSVKGSNTADGNGNGNGHSSGNGTSHYHHHAPNGQYTMMGSGSGGSAFQPLHGPYKHMARAGFPFSGSTAAANLPGQGVVGRETSSPPDSAPGLSTEPHHTKEPSTSEEEEQQQAVQQQLKMLSATAQQQVPQQLLQPAQQQGLAPEPWPLLQAMGLPAGLSVPPSCERDASGSLTATTAGPLSSHEAAGQLQAVLAALQAQAGLSPYLVQAAAAQQQQQPPLATAAAYAQQVAFSGPAGMAASLQRGILPASGSSGTYPSVLGVSSATASAAAAMAAAAATGSVPDPQQAAAAAAAAMAELQVAVYCSQQYAQLSSASGLQQLAAVALANQDMSGDAPGTLATIAPLELQPQALPAPISPPRPLPKASHVQQQGGSMRGGSPVTLLAAALALEQQHHYEAPALLTGVKRAASGTNNAPSKKMSGPGGKL